MIFTPSHNDKKETILKQARELVANLNLELDPEIKKAWVRALRSGAFEQGRAVLYRSDGTYCCLGVLAEVDKDFVRLHNNSYLWLEDPKNVGSSETALPEEFMHGDLQNILAGLNDEVGATFEEIADIIDECL